MRPYRTQILIHLIAAGVVIASAVLFARASEYVTRGVAPGSGGEIMGDGDYAASVQIIPGPAGEMRVSDEHGDVDPPAGQDTLRIVFRMKDSEGAPADSWQLISRHGPHYIRHANFPQGGPFGGDAYLLWTKETEPE